MFHNYSVTVWFVLQYGLYTAFMACFVYCLLGTSKDVNLGPAAVMSLLTAEFGHSVIHDDATYAIALSLVCGVFQIIMGVLQVGRWSAEPLSFWAWSLLST